MLEVVPLGDGTGLEGAVLGLREHVVGGILGDAAAANPAVPGPEGGYQRVGEQGEMSAT